MTDPQNNPLLQLEADHQAMGRLFAQWKQLLAARAPAAQRQALAEQICLELAIHTRLEEELLYPLAREASGDEALLDRAAQEHASARELMCRVLRIAPDHALYDARVTALCDFVEGHMDREAGVLYPRLSACGADLGLLGRRVRERRRELEAVPEALREDALVTAIA